MGSFQIIQHALIVLRSGWRGHVYRAVFVLGALLIGGAWLAASFSVRQAQIVALDVGFSGIRLVVTILSLFWVQDLLAKDIERKNVLWSLAFPVDRSIYLFGRFLGIALLSLSVCIILSLFLKLVVYAGGLPPAMGRLPDLQSGFWITVLLAWLDAVVVIAFSALITTFSTSSLMPLAMGLAFAVASRSLGGVLAYLMRPDSHMNPAFLESLRRIQWFLPDLSRLDVRDICLYRVGVPLEQIRAAILMAVGYICVTLFLSSLALRRREFS